ncbi:Ppx/GppA phosphatase family protein [Vitreimonas flagellata]|uniref:Ppx/GppA phosphatase family protein n=1 Tax=Vitreimonas flagellata TaxID=2560861 RepID=UPI001075106A|nr:Ppx/GppA phosphatase family protein [Vitreimonas flagellata]
MNKDRRAQPSRSDRRPGPRSRAPLYAALDLGTNNCRLLMAAPDGAGGLRVVDGFSRIVRLGEGLAHTGRLSESAMARAYQALVACAERIEARSPVAIGCVATQACRAAANGEVFLNRVRKDLGLDFQIISAEEEAKLSVLGCASLLEHEAEHAMIVDIGGGSTEISWVSPQAVLKGGLEAPILSWGTSPMGVVTLAEEEPEPDTDQHAWYDALVERLAEAVLKIGDVQHLRQAFAEGRGHIIGTSGTVTSLAGVHLDLPRYSRQRVDGMWFDVADCRATIAKLLAQTREERAANACIGKDRADLVVIGGAILDAVLRVWPATRIRVADRGLREGVLMRLMAQKGAA